MLRQMLLTGAFLVALQPVWAQDAPKLYGGVQQDTASLEGQASKDVPKLFGGVNKNAANGKAIILFPLQPRLDLSAQGSILETIQRKYSPPQQSLSAQFAPLSPPPLSSSALAAPPDLSKDPGYIERQQEFDARCRMWWHEAPSAMAQAGKDLDARLADLHARANATKSSAFGATLGGPDMSIAIFGNIELLQPSQAGGRLDIALSDLHWRILRLLERNASGNPATRLAVMTEDSQAKVRENAAKAEMEAAERWAKLIEVEANAHALFIDRIKNQLPDDTSRTVDGRLATRAVSAVLLPPDFGGHDNEDTGDRVVCWDPWYARFAELVKKPLMEQFSASDAVTGKDTVRITVSSDLSIKCEVLVAGNTTFDNAVTEAYRSLNFDPQLEFPAGTLRNEVSFLTEHRHLAKGDVIEIQAHKITGDLEHVHAR